LVKLLGIEGAGDFGPDYASEAVIQY